MRATTLFTLVFLVGASVLTGCASTEGAKSDEGPSGAAGEGGEVDPQAQPTDPPPAEPPPSEAPESTPSHAQPAPSSSRFDWAGCSSAVEKMLTIKCPSRRFMISLGRFSSDRPIDDAMLLQVRTDFLRGTLQAARPKLVDSFVDLQQPRLLTTPNGGLDAVLVDAGGAPGAGTLLLLAATLPYEEQGQHFVVMYLCAGAEEQTCTEALVDVVTYGAPRL